MKFLQYLQVLLLLTILGLILLVQLENPIELKLPLFFGGHSTVSLGWFLLGTVGVGALYTFSLMLPPYLRSLFAVRHERRKRADLQKLHLGQPEVAPAEGQQQA